MALPPRLDPRINGSPLSIKALWGPRKEDLRACALRFAALLDGLTALNPIFKRWTAESRWTMATTRRYPPPQTPGSLAGLIERGERFQYGDQSIEPQYGYCISAESGKENHRTIRVSADVGNYVSTRPDCNYVSLFFVGRSPGNRDLIRPSFLRQALLVCVATWRPDWASVELVHYARRWNTSLHSFPDKQPWAGWMTYLSAPLAERIVPPALVASERTPDGGLLMLATRQQFDVTLPPHVAATDAIQAALRPIQR